jgi:hypothetical protein
MRQETDKVEIPTDYVGETFGDDPDRPEDEGRRIRRRRLKNWERPNRT